MTPEEFETEREYYFTQWEEYKRGEYVPLWKQKKVIKMSLENVKIRPEFAEADFYPENGSRGGHIVVKLPEGGVLVCTEAPGYERFYTERAREALVEMAETKDRRKEILVVWHREC